MTLLRYPKVYFPRLSRKMTKSRISVWTGRRKVEMVRDRQETFYLVMAYFPIIPWLRVVIVARMYYNCNGRFTP